MFARSGWTRSRCLWSMSLSHTANLRRARPLRRPLSSAPQWSRARLRGGSRRNQHDRPRRASGRPSAHGASRIRVRVRSTIPNVPGADLLRIGAPSRLSQGFGVVAYSVEQRRYELGIRRALGAHAADLFGLILRQAMKPVVAGFLIGVVAALAIGRLIQALLFDVSAFDPATITPVALAIGIAAFGACYIPARRAPRVDPMVACATSEW